MSDSAAANCLSRRLEACYDRRLRGLRICRRPMVQEHGIDSEHIAALEDSDIGLAAVLAEAVEPYEAGEYEEHLVDPLLLPKQDVMLLECGDFRVFENCLPSRPWQAREKGRVEENGPVVRGQSQCLDTARPEKFRNEPSGPGGAGN